jgi:hypothetical protein
MHLLLSAPREAAPTRQPLPTRGSAPYAALTLLWILFAALPGFAQSVVTSITGMNGPTFLAIDANRTIGGTTATWLYVSEHGQSTNTGGGRILRYNVASLATPPADIGGGNFTSPDGILIDPATGNLTIADRARNRIVRLSNTGALLSTFGSSTVGAADEMHGPAELATDGSGNIYIAEHGDTTGTIGNGGSFVSKYTSAGTRVWRIGGIGGANAQFSNTGPYGVAIIGSTLYVSDGFNSRVQTFDLNGVYQSQFSLPGALPLGLNVDSANALWIAQGTNSPDGRGSIQQVQKFPTPGGAATVTLTGGLSLPFHVVVNPATNIAYVSDYYNNRVQVYDLSATPPTAVPVINSSATQSGTVGVGFNYSLTATNSPISYAATDALPDGLTLDTTSGAITGTPTTAGTTTTHFTATNSVGTSASFALTVTIAAATPPPPAVTAPSITSIALGGNATYTHANFVVTFSSAVTGVDTTDFAFNRTGTTGAATITDVTPSADQTTYTVAFTYDGDPATHTTDTLNGSLQLGIKTSGTGITDLSSNAFVGNGTTASEAIQVNAPAPGADLTLPVVSSFTGALSGSTATFTLTFSKPVTGVDAADFLINKSGTTATLGSITADTTGTIYTIPVTVGGNGTVSLTVIGGVTANIRDAATNWFAGGGTSTSDVVTVGTPAGSVPVVSNATVTGTVGTPIGNVQVQATNSPTSFSAPNLATYGLAISSSGVISGTPTAAAANATVSVTATNASGTSAPATITLNISATPPAGSAPVVSNATVTGTVGTPIANVQVQATNSPTSFSAPDLATYGLAISSSGVISGTPTAAAATTVSVTATNASGTSAPATITLNISATPPAGSAPVVSNATVTGTVGTPIANVQVQATNSPTSFSAPDLATYGLAISSSGVISGTPTAAAATTVSVTATNASGTSAPATITLNISATPPAGSAPVVTSTSVNGTVGVPMQFTIVATNSPTQFSIGAQPPGISIDTNGVVSGVPAASGTFLATVTASNSAGSGSGTVTFTIAESTGGTGNRKGQTVIFNAPTSAIVIGTPVRLGATSDSGGPIVYTIISGNAVVSDDMLTVKGSGPVVIKASQSGDSTWEAASATTTITAQKAGQTINVSSLVRQVSATDRINLDADASSGLPVTYAVVSGPGYVDGNVLTFTGGSGVVLVRASQGGDDSYNPANDITLTFNVNVVGQQVYFGKLGSDDFAAAISADNKQGTLITRLSATGEALIVKFAIAADGSFSTQATSVLPRASTAADGGTTAAAAASRTFTGTVANGSLSGTVAELGANFSGAAQPATGSTVAYSGMYTATIPGSASGNTYLVVGSNGQAYALIATPNAVASGMGTVGTNGAVSVTTSGGGTITGTLDANRSAISGTIKMASAPAANFAGLSASAVATDRLVNISSRLEVDSSRMATAGFVVNGTTPKQILIRAVGPGLNAFGVSNGLPDPKLQLFDNDGKPVGANAGWNDDAAIAAAGDASGAFKLGKGSKDAAMLITLAPGAYTAQVTTGNNDGLVLIEVYDVASGTTVPTKQLINISTRGFVGTGNSALVGGFVVSGNQPKRVLIRAVGPSLTKFGVTDLLADPVLTIYDHSKAIIAKNDNWGTPQPIDSTQIAATASDITTADTNSGAFPLLAGSADAAVIITLNPGDYTAMVTGANNTTGTALVEVYEIPNP